MVVFLFRLFILQSVTSDVSSSIRGNKVSFVQSMGISFGRDQLWKGYSGGRTMVINHIIPLRTFHMIYFVEWDAMF